MYIIPVQDGMNKITETRDETHKVFGRLHFIEGARKVISAMIIAVANIVVAIGKMKDQNILSIPF